MPALVRVTVTYKAIVGELGRFFPLIGPATESIFDKPGVYSRPGLACAATEGVVMPLDDTNWAGIVVQDSRDSAAPYAGSPFLREHRRSRRTCIRFEHVVLAAMGMLLLGVLAYGSEDMFPDSGLITRITYGNAVADRNFIARAILANSQRLTFTVAGTQYEVDTPSRPLTHEEQQALLGYAEWKGLPRYSADGPLAIDP